MVGYFGHPNSRQARNCAMSERILMKFIVGQRVVKEGEDSRFEGEVVACFRQARLEDPALCGRERRRRAAHRQRATIAAGHAESARAA